MIRLATSLLIAVRKAPVLVVPTCCMNASENMLDVSSSEKALRTDTCMGVSYLIDSPNASPSRAKTQSRARGMSATVTSAVHRASMSERIHNLLLSRQFFMRMVMLHQTEQIKPPLFTSPVPDRNLRNEAVAGRPPYRSAIAPA